MEETSPDKGNSKNLYIIGAIILVAVGAGAYFIYKDSQSNDTVNQVKEEVTDGELSPAELAAIQEEKAKQEAEKLAMLKAQEMQEQEELDKNVIIYKSYVIEIEPVLSPSGQDALDLVREYIDADNRVLLSDVSTYPQNIQDALELVKSEAKQKLGTIAVKQTQTNSTDQEEIVGKVVTGTGVLEVEDTIDENPFGPVYKIVNEDDGGTYYFMFGTTRAEDAAELVGERVDIEVKITAVDEDNNLIAYDVISGPTLAEDTEIESDTDTDTDTETAE